MLQRILERNHEPVQSRQVGAVVGAGHIVAEHVPIEIGIRLSVVHLGIDVQPVQHPKIGDHERAGPYCNSRTEP